MLRQWLLMESQVTARSGQPAETPTSLTWTPLMKLGNINTLAFTLEVLSICCGLATLILLGDLSNGYNQVADWPHIWMKARSIRVKGVVQGVGFRPFVYKLAVSLGLVGSVKNSGKGVEILVQGDDAALESFVERLRAEAPPVASIEEIVVHEAKASSARQFRVVTSSATNLETLPPPDLAICADCASEILDPNNRRFQYPLTNCMNCGPRFSIIRSLPYDRSRTTMNVFKLCKRCASEYKDPKNRRFRAEPISCPTCGPKVWYMRQGKIVRTNDPLAEAARDLDAGATVAVKGMGGFHLAVDATNEDAVSRLRHIKRRHDKPFAMMARDLAHVRSIAILNGEEEKWLRSAPSPILLLKKRIPNPIAPDVAPGLDTFGIMLPYTGIHLMLLARTSSPYLVMTSGNPKDEVIVHDNDVAIERLSEMASSFLLYNRSILNFEDDSVMKVVDDVPIIFRRSRGFVPVPIRSPVRVDGILGLGADLKNTFAVGKLNRIFVSQHIGDLDSEITLSSVGPAIERLTKLVGARYDKVAHDMHPGYRSTELAESMGIPRVQVQHHHAHLVSSAASNGMTGDMLGLACDGTGFSPDGQIWGFELMTFNFERFERVGSILPFRLPGSEAAILDPRRCAVSLLHAALGDDADEFDLGYTSGEQAFILQMIKSGINSPLASSCGRLFDAVSAMLGICSATTYEGQPAIELEACAKSGVEGSYPYRFASSDRVILDHRPMIRAIAEDLKSQEAKGMIAAKFHNTMVRAMAEMITIAAERSGMKKVVLGGGSFCNSLLVRGLTREVRRQKIDAVMPKLLPPNDGGISYGQVVVASTR